MKNFLSILLFLIKYLFSNKKRYLNLFYYILKNHPKTILEIGIYKGTRSKEMIQLAKIFNKKITYYGFDLFEEITKKEKENELSKYPNSYYYIHKLLKKFTDNVNLYKGNTSSTLKVFSKNKKKIDLIFIDGGHKIATIKNDWKFCSKLLKKGSILIFDDYYLNNKKLISKYGCNQLINKLKKNKIKIKLLPFTDYFYIKGIKTGIRMVAIKI